MSDVQEIAWTGEPPESLAAPKYYRGILARRVFTFWVDLICIGLLIVFVDRRRRTLHDILAGTLVTRQFPQAESLARR